MEKELFHVGLHLSFAVKGNSERIWTTLIGWEANSVFIVKLPYTEGEPATLFSGNNCLIRFMKDGDAYGFEAKVISIQYQPIALVYFEYPIYIEALPIRISNRFATNIPVRILFADTITIDAVIANISESGCLIKTSLSMDDELEIKKEFASLKRNCKLTFNTAGIAIDNLECIVKNIRNVQTGENHILFGMQFSDITLENEKNIYSLINLFAISQV